MVRRTLCALLLAAAAVVVPAGSASAHKVVCTNDAMQPFFNGDPSPGREVAQGATIIECSPTAPDGQRTTVQLQILRNGSWVNRGGAYVSQSNARFHRVYDSTSCFEDRRDTWRTRAVHRGVHGNTVEKTDISPHGSFVCYYNA